MVKNNIENYRRSSRMTNSELAKAIGVCPSYVTLLLNNERQPSIEIALRLVDCFKCKFEDLFSHRAGKNGR